VADPLRISFDLPFEDAIAAAVARKVMLPEDYYGQVPGVARRVSTTVSSLAGLDQVQAVIDSLNGATAKGQSLADWQRWAELQDWGLSKARLETVFRTNVQTAYSAGHWRAFEEHKARRPYLMWSAINDSRVRPTHLAMDGHVAPVDAAVWKVWHAPAGYNCRCTQISLTEAQAMARGYGRQMLPKVQPDAGFGGGPPGDLEGAITRVATRKVSAAPPAVRQAFEQRIQPKPPGPRGPAVGDSLVLPPGSGAVPKSLRETRAIIDALHGDGNLPSIPVATSATKTKHGLYRFARMSDNAVGIEVSRFSDHSHLTFAHEIGHFLDHKGWGGRGFSAGSEAAAEAWRKVVAASSEVRQLADLRTKGTYAGVRKWARYATSWEELWARSYAQWVAVRSGDKTMLQELTKIKTESTLEAYRLSQWGAAEFEPIAKAIDDLFALLGWRHP
jgi:SPP1 gp7 family putative phage head morphogenesis protein